MAGGDDMTLGEKLKSCRTKKKLSQEKVAELVGVSRQAVTKWENNQTVPKNKRTKKAKIPSYVPT